MQVEEKQLNKGKEIEGEGEMIGGVDMIKGCIMNMAQCIGKKRKIFIMLLLHYFLYEI